MHSIDCSLFLHFDKRRNIQSPINYPGSKRAAIEHVLSLIPEHIDKLVSPFFGGGSVELAVASTGIEVFGYDVFDFVVDFWNTVLYNKEPLLEAVKKEYPMTRDRFYEIRYADYSSSSPLEKAIAFYLLNKSSFSGTAFSGGCSSQSLKRFNQTAIQRLEDFECDKLHVGLSAFEETLAKHKNDFIYLDPPYINKAQNLYGKNGNTHRKFNHELLAELLNKRQSWVLSYNNCEQVQSLYKDRRILVTNWSHPMSVDFYEEVLVISDNLPDVYTV